MTWTTGRGAGAGRRGIDASSRHALDVGSYLASVRPDKKQGRRVSSRWLTRLERGGLFQVPPSQDWQATTLASPG